MSDSVHLSILFIKISLSKKAKLKKSFEIATKVSLI